MSWNNLGIYYAKVGACNAKKVAFKMPKSAFLGIFYEIDPDFYRCCKNAKNNASHLFLSF